jgi:hypothetical protein
MVRKEFLVDFLNDDLWEYIVGSIDRAFENYNYTSKITFPNNYHSINKILKYSSCYCKIVYMKPENRISKILEKRVLKDEDPKLIAQIEKYLAELEFVFVKWAKAHPNWKESEE